MATKTFTNEAVALTEKKMDMTLDDIIKMSKNSTSKGKKQRVWNRNNKSVNTVAQVKGAKVQKFMGTRSIMRQGALAQRRSNFQGNQFPLTTEAVSKAAAVPIHNSPFKGIGTVNFNKPRVGAPMVQRRAVNGGGFNLKQSQQQVKVPPKQRSQTLDSLFADMKEQRMKVLSQRNNSAKRNVGSQRLPPWKRARFGK